MVCVRACPLLILFSFCSVATCVLIAAFCRCCWCCWPGQDLHEVGSIQQRQGHPRCAHGCTHGPARCVAFNFLSGCVSVCRASFPPQRTRMSGPTGPRGRGGIGEGGGHRGRVWKSVCVRGESCTFAHGWQWGAQPNPARRWAQRALTSATENHRSCVALMGSGSNPGACAWRTTSACRPNWSAPLRHLSRPGLSLRRACLPAWGLGCAGPRLCVLRCRGSGLSSPPLVYL